jgi:hypothetical protein
LLARWISAMTARVVALALVRDWLKIGSDTDDSGSAIRSSLTLPISGRPSDSQQPRYLGRPPRRSAYGLALDGLDRSNAASLFKAHLALTDGD